jgi:[protein-PII] uridylyltransferase
VLRGDIVRALDGTLDISARLARREASQAQRPGIEVPPPSVDVVQDASDAATVIEIRAHDRPGLLHRVGRALAAAEVDIRSAKVTTWGAEAVDVFYVVDPVTGEPLDETRAEAVRKSVLDALD